MVPRSRISVFIGRLVVGRLVVVGLAGVVVGTFSPAHGLIDANAGLACEQSWWSGTWARTEHPGTTVTFSQSGRSVGGGNYTWGTGGAATNLQLSNDCMTMTGSYAKPAPSSWAITLTGRTSFSGNWRWGTTQEGRWDGSFGGTCAAGPCAVVGATPVASPAIQVGLNMAYRRPARLIPDEFGVIPPTPGPETVKPQGFPVELLVRRSDRRPCQPGDAFTWSVRGRSFGSRDLGPSDLGACRQAVELPEGVHTLEATMTALDGTTGRGTVVVTVQDWLVFGLGDSNGSGEGDPDNVESRRGSLWTDSRCHRSSGSFEAQTAVALEVRDELTSVTFAHLACSGAAIRAGMIGAYEGIEPAQPPLSAQIDEMVRLAQGREIDAVLISIGINDLGFGPLLVFCITTLSCPRAKGFDAKRPEATLHEFVSGLLPDPKVFDNARALRDPRYKDTLFVRYNEMAGALKRAGVKADRVYITQYFDSTRDQNGIFCNPLVGIPNPGGLVGLNEQFDPLGLFDLEEAAWAFGKVLVPLNRTMRAAAQKHGWRIVVGAEQGFATHGYCAGNESWIVPLTGSLLNQGNVSGAFHATRVGNAFTSSLVQRPLLSALYPSGRARPPRE